VRRIWNKQNPDKKIVSFAVDLTESNLYDKLTKAGKTIVISYKTSFAHYKDSQDNGKLDNKCFVSCGEKQTGGHCIRHRAGLNIDNYDGRKKFNVY
jgi:hypothetical protein